MSLYCIIHTDSRLSRNKGATGTLKNLIIKTNLAFYLQTVIYSWETSVLVTGWPRPAWSWGLEGRQRRGGTERRKGEQWDVHGIHLSIYNWHLFKIFSLLVKGEPASGGASVTGPKGEPGQRVGSRWLDLVYQLYSKLYSSKIKKTKKQKKQIPKRISHLLRYIQYIS